jgi:hypothetical protein
VCICTSKEALHIPDVNMVILLPCGEGKESKPSPNRDENNKRVIPE